MDITVYPGLLSGPIQIIPSKSQAHRLLICAAFSDRQTDLICPATSQDMDATAKCLNALGAAITRTENGYHIKPVRSITPEPVLDCAESGSTLRFLLPVVAALGIRATFTMSGRLPQRPLSPLWEELERKGCTLSRPTENTLSISGQLACGEYTIDGSVSSQFISGLLFALSLLPGKSQLKVTGKIESVPYILMTKRALKLFGVKIGDEHITGDSPFVSPGTLEVEGDWSNAAFFLAANALGSQVEVIGLDHASVQGDRESNRLIPALADNISISGEDIPDLIPILSVVAGYNKGATFHNIGRLRLKESDRIDSVVNMLQKLGCRVSSGADWIQVDSAVFHGCIIDAHNDHRIAMSAAIAATVADGPVTIIGADCVKKSYPDFWKEFEMLGGHYEQHIR